MKYFWNLICNLLNTTYLIINSIRKFFLNIIFLIFLLSISIILIEKNLNKKNFSYKKIPLLININGLITEKKNCDNKIIFFFLKLLKLNFQKNEKNSIFEIVEKIRQAKKDNKISGIILNLQNFSGSSQNLLEYMGKSLEEFKSSKKPIYSIGNNYSQSQYYLSSFANKIFLYSKGEINIDMFNINEFYYKNFLKYSKIRSNIFRIEKYKSICKTLQNKKNNFLWKRFIHQIKKNRNIHYKDILYSKKKLIKELNKKNGNFIKYVKEKKLVDFVYPYPKVRKILIKKFGFDKKKNDFNYIDINNYQLQKKKKINKIAVIILNGIILNNENKNFIIKKIKIAKQRKDIKALIFRINSPGGNIISSERIREELIDFKNSKKPVVISMGQITASGGYWIASAGDYIFAHPTTLIGSIGVFSILNKFNKSFKILGVNNNQISALFCTENNVFKKLKNNERKIIQLKLKYNYLKFLKKISQSRNLPLKKVKKLAKEKIWIGIECKSNGLIDAIGDFDDAVKKAISLSKISDYQIFWVKENNFFLELIKNKIELLFNSLFYK